MPSLKKKCVLVFMGFLSNFHRHLLLKLVQNHLQVYVL